MIFSGHQPNFLPYMGYLYKMYKSDVFVLDDDVQYSKTEYQSYNYIKVQGQRSKLTVPVVQNFGQKINEVKILYEGRWKEKMLRTLEVNYKKAEHFEEGYEFIKRHLDANYDKLVHLNFATLREIVERFGIDTKLVIASEVVPTKLTKNERNIYQCKKLGCDVYLSGVGGKDYNDEKAYEENGIKIIYSDYEPVKYKQVGWNFIENLSCIDYIFNEGFKIPKNWEK